MTKTKPLSTGTLSVAAHIKPPEMVEIPAGEFWMGTSFEQIQFLLEHEAWAEDWFARNMFQTEQPYHKVHTAAFEIASSPVTNYEYHLFVWDTGYRLPRGWGGLHYLEEEAFHPVTGISRDDGLAYCAWLGQQLARLTGEAREKFQYRLPTEAEWEHAARGADGRLYPWGNDFDPWRCNTADSAKGGTTPVGYYSPSGDSPFGIEGMSGNVWEWTSSALRPYPFKPEVENGEADSSLACVIRGGGWYYSHKLARCAARESALPGFVSASLGFRIVRSVGSAG